MKIAISALHLKESPADGVSRFTYESVKRLILNNPNDNFFLISGRPLPDSLIFGPNAENIVIPTAGDNPFNWWYWHERKLPGILRQTGADLFFSPEGFVSLSTDVPQVPVIHDISFYHRPGDLPFIRGVYHRYYCRKFARRAARIITVSGYCRSDISEYLNVDASKIDVAWNGVSDYFSPIPEPEKNGFRLNLTGGVPYFLFVGNFSPRKNIPGLLRAWHLFRRETSFPHKLVLAGGRLYLNSETDRMIRFSPLRDDIILTGPIPHASLAPYYSSAEALVFVPWFEGFGIPAAEAMRCGTPAILSSVTSLPEVGGEAAIYANPGNTEEICSAMKKIVTDNSLRASLVEHGIEQSAKFTWENTAGCIMKSLQMAVK